MQEAAKSNTPQQNKIIKCTQMIEWNLWEARHGTNYTTEVSDRTTTSSFQNPKVLPACCVSIGVLNTRGCRVHLGVQTAYQLKYIFKRFLCRELQYWMTLGMLDNSKKDLGCIPVSGRFIAVNKQISVVNIIAICNRNIYFGHVNWREKTKFSQNILYYSPQLPCGAFLYWQPIKTCRWRGLVRANVDPIISK